MSNYEKLKKYISQIDNLIENKVTYYSPEFKSWHANCLRFLINTYGETSIEVENFKGINFQTYSFDKTQQIIHCANAFKTTKATFENLLEDLAEETEGEDSENNSINNNKVFIVHGHDGELKYKVARLLEKLGLEPIILHEKINSSRTIIEKIEKYGSEAQAAIILFTPDDVGKANSEDDTKSRGRQNVVFEAGYFMGLLGRNKTILIVSDRSIELPGDLSGVVYSGTLDFEIARELNAMGFKIDMNKLLQ